ncbi:hypothetical protein ACFQE0_26160 [Methylobacterium komagatae]|uniref:Uncharacterized protein n=1 Tax=Methylobacterium komagatae TaxID=374425 RepID=A0ABW2BQI0_9HYPH
MDWRFSSFLIFLFALLFAVPWATSDTGLCGIAIAQKAMTGEDATTCFEFWLNRYQTLVGTLIALSAALLALLPARGQLQEMRRQSAISARQSSIEVAKDLEAEISTYKSLEWIKFRLMRLLKEYDEESFERIYQHWPDQIWELHHDLKIGCEKAFFFFDRYPGTSDLFFVRQTFKAAAIDLDNCFWALQDSFRRQTFGADYEEGEEDITTSEAEIIRRKVEGSILLFEECRQKASKEVNLAKDEAWRSARHFEGRAIRY